MALTDNGNDMVMPVQPMWGGYGNNGGFGFGGDWGSLIVLFLIAAMFGGFGGGFGMGGYGNGMLGIDFPWLLQGQNGINQNTNAGFNQAATQSLLDNIQTALCSGFASTNANINGAQSAISQQLYANEIANLERSFAAQTANTQGQNAIQSQLAQCCCDNRLATNDLKYTIANEACANRATSTANTQVILDKLCQLELDTAKTQIAAEQRENANLRTELMYARGQASQVEQTAELRQAQATNLNNLVSELRSCPIPAQPVYGSQPIFTCGGNSGCGCNNF